MPSCAAFNCTNRQFKGCGKTFHRFPRSNPDLVKRWIIAIQCENYQPGPKAVICSDHFADRCFDRTGQNIRLRDDSIPTLLKFDQHLMRTAVRPRKPSEDSTSSTCSLQSATSPELPSLTLPTSLSQRSQCDLQCLQRERCVRESQTSLKHNLNVGHQDTRHVRTRLKAAHQSATRRHMKVYSLQEVIERLRSKQPASGDVQ